MFDVHVLMQERQSGLVINAAIIDDTGIYVCQATNGFGSAELTYHLHVIGERWAVLSQFCLYICKCE